MDFSFRFLFMLVVFTPVAVTLGFLRPFYGLCMLCFLYFFRPDIWGAADWFRPWNWITLAVSLGWLIHARTLRFHWNFGLCLLFLAAIQYSGVNARVSATYAGFAVETVAKLIWVTWLTLQLVDTRKKAEIFIWANFAGMVWNVKTVLFSGIASGGTARVDVGIAQGGGANYIALILNIFIPWLLLHAENSPGRKRKWSIFFLPLWALSLVFTGSRSGLLGLMILLGFHFTKSKHKAQGVALAFLLGLIVIATMPASEKERFIQGFQGEGKRDGSAQQRIDVWNAALQMFEESPIHGVGPDNFHLLSYHYVGYHANKYRENSEGGRQGYVTHNTWLQVLSEGGILASVPYVLLYLSSFWFLYRIRKMRHPKDEKNTYFILSSAMEGMLIAFMISSTFGSYMKNDALWWFFGYIGALHLCALNDQRAADERRGAEERERRLAAKRQALEQKDPAGNLEPTLT